MAQGNDTDSFGCTGGAILGTFFGPGHLGQRWLEPFHDEIRTGLSFFFERSLSKVADRIAALPARIAAELALQTTAAPSTPQKSHDAGAG